MSVTHLAKGLNAKEWCDVCIAVAGAGKGGGKPELANASIPGDLSVLEKILTEAKNYVSARL